MLVFVEGYSLGASQGLLAKLELDSVDTLGYLAYAFVKVVRFGVAPSIETIEGGEVSFEGVALEAACGGGGFTRL